MRWPLFLLAPACLCSLAQAQEISFKQAAEVCEKAFPIGNGELRARVKGRTGIEPMAIFPKGGRHVATPQVPGNALTGPAWITFSLDWLAKDAKVTNYQRTLNLQDGTVVTTFNRGGVGFTWTVFATDEQDLIVTHLRADKPGALNFRVSLSSESPAKARVEDRRILIFEGKSEGKPFAARAWVFPMESEVTPGDKEITVRGEGEALILLAATRDPEQIAKLQDRIKPLGFGGDDHPDIFQVWTNLLEHHTAAHRKAMEGAGEKKQAILNRYVKLAVTSPGQLKDNEPLPQDLENLVFPEIPDDPAQQGEILPPTK